MRSRRCRHRRQQPVVPPPPPVQPEHDPEFRTLPIDRRTWIITWWDHMLELDRVRFKKVAAEAIAERYGEAVGDKRLGHGFSRTNLMRRYAAWVSAGRDWRVLDRYRSLRKAKVAPPPERYNLTPESAHEYCRRLGLTLEKWAETRGFVPSAVSRALSGKRADAMSARILDRMAAELRGEPGVLHAALRQLRSEWSAFGPRLDALEKRLPRH